MQERKLRLYRSIVGAVLMLGVATPLFWVKFGAQYGGLVLALSLGVSVTAVLQLIAYLRLKKEEKNENKDEK